MFKNFIDKWKKKSLFSKFTDILFTALIFTLLIPEGRMAVGGFVNGLKAKVSQPSLMDSGVVLSDQAYEWSMEDIKRESFNLNESKGKVVFLNLWATWCPPCVGEMPGIQKLYDKFKDDPNVEFIMVSNEDMSVIAGFMEKKKYSFPVYSSKSATPDVFASRSIPTTYVVSKSGDIVIKEIGAVNWGGKKMEGIIGDLLK